MSIIDRAVEAAGLTMQADTLPKGHRTVKDFQRLVAAMRAAEAHVMEDARKSERELNEALQRNLELQEENHRLRNELQRRRIAERLEGIESLTTADRQKLLEVNADPVKANGS